MSESAGISAASPAAKGGLGGLGGGGTGSNSNGGTAGAVAGDWKRASHHVQHAASDVRQSVDHVMDAMRESWEQRVQTQTRAPTFDEMRSRFALLLRPAWMPAHQLTLLSPQVQVLGASAALRGSLSHTVQSDGADSLALSLSHTIDAPAPLEAAASTVASKLPPAGRDGINALRGSMGSGVSGNTGNLFSRASHSASLVVPLASPLASFANMSALWEGLRDLGVDVRGLARITARSLLLQHDIKTPYVSASIGLMSENGVRRVGLAGNSLLYQSADKAWQALVGAKVVSPPLGSSSSVVTTPTTMSAMLQASGPGGLSDVQVAGDVSTGEITHVGLRTFTHSLSPEYPRTMFGMGIAAGVGSTTANDSTQAAPNALALWKTAPGLFDDVAAVQRAVGGAAASAAAVASAASGKEGSNVSTSSPQHVPHRLNWASPILTSSLTCWTSPAARWHLTADSFGTVGMQWSRQWNDLLHVQASAWASMKSAVTSGAALGGLLDKLEPRMSVSIVLGE